MSQSNPLPLIARAPVIPVVVIERLEDAVPLARALVEGGLPLIEVTLRTPGAARHEPDRRRGGRRHRGRRHRHRPLPDRGGGGSGRDLYRHPRHHARARAQALAEAPVPVLPGCATASEAMALDALGFKVLKFFPAEPSGGAPFLKGLAGPLPALRFCPTGGIGPSNAPDYLALPNVVAVGGSWVVPGDAIKAGNFDKVRELSAAAAKLPRAAKFD